MRFMNRISFWLLLAAFLLIHVFSFGPVASGTSNQVSNSTAEDRPSNVPTNRHQFPIERAKQADIVFGAISKGNESYHPNPIYVDVNYFVTWLNTDSILHTVTSGTGMEDNTKGSEFDSPVLRPGEAYSHKFQTAGRFAYFCFLHPSMIGSVVVGSNSSNEA
jgi:plastocyanin